MESHGSHVPVIVTIGPGSKWGIMQLRLCCGVAPLVADLGFSPRPKILARRRRRWLGHLGARTEHEVYDRVIETSWPSTRVLAKLLNAVVYDSGADDEECVGLEEMGNKVA